MISALYSNAHFGMVAGMQEMVMFSLEHSPREKLINSQNTLKLRELSRTHDQTGAHISSFFFLSNVSPCLWRRLR